MRVIRGRDVHLSYGQVVPLAAELGRGWRARIRDWVSAQQLDVEMTDEQMSDNYMDLLGGRRNRQMLVVTPQPRHLRGFSIVHYGFPLGTNLATGWLVISTTGNGLEVLDYFDFLDLQALVEAIHQGAVMPALIELATAVGLDTTYLRYPARWPGATGEADYRRSW